MTASVAVAKVLREFTEIDKQTKHEFIQCREIDDCKGVCINIEYRGARHTCVMPIGCVSHVYTVDVDAGHHTITGIMPGMEEFRFIMDQFEDFEPTLLSLQDKYPEHIVLGAID